MEIIMKHSIKHTLRIFTLLILCQATVTVPIWRQKAKQLAMNATITATAAIATTALNNKFSNQKILTPASDQEQKFIRDKIAEVTDATDTQIMHNTNTANQSYEAMQSIFSPQKIIIIEKSPTEESLNDLLTQQALIEKKLERHAAAVQHEAGHNASHHSLKQTIFAGTTYLGLITTYVVIAAIYPISNFLSLPVGAIAFASSNAAFSRHCETEADLFIKDPKKLRALADWFEEKHVAEQYKNKHQQKRIINAMKSYSILTESTRPKAALIITNTMHYIQSFFADHPPIYNRAAEFRRRADENKTKINNHQCNNSKHSQITKIKHLKKTNTGMIV
jgi:hypothetical protein